ncbi:MAG: hypothetical protein QM764_03935 [Chitinophagaceae bacterium]
MEKKMILKAGFLTAVIAVGFGVLLSFSKPSGSKTSVQSGSECCKKTSDTDSSGNALFESLPGKFFSTVLIY